MDNLSSVTLGDATFPVLASAGGGGSGVIEGEYTIPEVYWCNSDGDKPPSGNTIAGQNAKVWYQRTGKYVRAMIAFNMYAAASRIYAVTFGFNRADLFGDGKLFPENSEPVFLKFFGFDGLNALVSGSNNPMRLEPFLSLATSTSGADSVYFYIKNTNTMPNFPNTNTNGKNVILIEAVCL